MKLLTKLDELEKRFSKPVWIILNLLAAAWVIIILWKNLSL
jgi:hypothetical protein